jgi:hypothetical protein
VDRVINAATTEQRLVGRGHDGMDVLHVMSPRTTSITATRQIVACIRGREGGTFADCASRRLEYGVRGHEGGARPGGTAPWAVFVLAGSATDFHVLRRL